MIRQSYLFNRHTLDRLHQNSGRILAAGGGFQIAAATDAAGHPIGLACLYPHL